MPPGEFRAQSFGVGVDPGHDFADVVGVFGIDGELSLPSEIDADADLLGGVARGDIGELFVQACEFVGHGGLPFCRQSTPRFRSRPDISPGRPNMGMVAW